MPPSRGEKLSVPMPDSLPDPSPPAKSALPTRRSEDAKPRAFADQTAEPIGLPGAVDSLHPAPADPSGRREKSELPRQRKKERDLPALTPAPYQSDPTPGSAPGMRAALPVPRGPDELPKFRPPTETAEAHDSRAVVPAPPSPATPTPPEPAAPAPRPIIHRLAANRRPEMTPQGTIDSDPEAADHWGQSEQGANPEHRSSRHLVLWAALIGVPLLGFALWQSLGRPGASAPPTTTPVVASPGSTTDPAEESRQAGEAARRFMAAATIDERAALVRHPEVTKARMEAWYSAANPLKPQATVEFDDRSSDQTIDGTNFIILKMLLADRPKGQWIAVEKRPGGEYLVDWESFASWSEPRWPEFLSTEPTGAHDFRVVVKIDNYFNFGYTDPQQWFCYSLTDPENWASCWGYCPIDSESGMKLNRMIRRQRQEGEDQIRAILKLKFEDAGKGRNQVIIEDVVEDGWIKVGP